MRRRRLPLGLAVSLLLIGLVALFATLQYRWLGQASEADREQMRRSVNERARQFAVDFDREVARVYSAFRASNEDGGEAVTAQVAERLALWRGSTRFQTLVRNVYTVRLDNGVPLLFRFSPARSALEPTEWPDRFSAFRARVSARSASETRFVAISSLAGIAPSDPAAPALLIPPGRSAVTYTIVDLDPAVLQAILAELTEQYFGGENGDPYRVVVFDTKEQAVFASDGRTARLGEGSDAGAALFQLRPNFTEAQMLEVRSFRIGEEGPASAADRTVVFTGSNRINLIGRTPGTTMSRIADTWTLVVQHPRGSIDAAVDAGRRRNLWVSFGILSLMIAGMALVMVNARRSQRLAAQQMEFVATVSHELRTPVAAMRAAAQNLSAGVVPDPDRIRLYGDLIETEGRRLTEMVEQVLEYSGVGGDRTLNLASLNPRDLVQRAVESCRPLAAAAGCAIDVDLPDDLPTITGDATALHRAVSNLIANAVKHGADGKWVGVSVGSATGKGGRPELQISVGDRGQGIDADDLPHIFEPFHRGRRALDRQIQGSGLGLSLVQRIAEAHGGRATAKSVPGEGATFTIHLPA